MNNNSRFLPMAVLTLLSILFIPARPAAADTGLSKRLQSVAAKDTVCNVWIHFKDRPSASGSIKVSEQAMQRRRKANFRAGDESRPIERRYISEIERRGGELRHAFSWENAVSFSVHSSRLNEIASLPFVNSVTPVAVYVRKSIDHQGTGLGKASAPAAAFDHGYDWYMEQVNIPFAHEYLKFKKLGDPGRGVLMAIFDTGFRLGHRAFSYIKDSSSVVSTRDFVDGGTLVHAPDSVAGNSRHPYYQADKHGTQVLALIAGHHPSVYMGTAWGARFALARTEDYNIEARIEEDNWAAAVEWAEALGAGIISSSLGYRDGFDDPDENYSKQEMDGKTTIVSRAAAGAVARGVIVVNSIGNEYNDSLCTLTAPADVNGVISVGAVTRNRTLASFSSAGPTADGRMKPEVVAPGVSVRVLLPAPYSTWSVTDSTEYAYGSGTSFSTPIVAGIMALILQANPRISAEEARERLFRSCAFAYGQTYPNNKFGYGIPNALSAVMARNDVFVNITDSTGAALVGAQVRAGANTYTIDSTGYLLIEGMPMSALPLEHKILFREKEVGVFIVDTLPFARIIDIEIKRDNGIKVLPTVVKRNSVVRGKYQFATMDAFSAPVVAVVRTLNGRKVWEQRLAIRPDGTAEFSWDCRRGANRVAAGVYIVTVRHKYNMFSERILVTN